MKDLLLCRLLRAPEIDPARVAPLLDELASLSLPERFPFLGLLPRALAHEAPALRAAALNVLAGADGRLAFVHLVAALSDPDAAVRLAAVEALRDSSLGHPARWAHALFHASPEIRLAAVQGPWPDGTASFAFYLLSDPAVGPELLRRIEAEDPALGGEPIDRPIALHSEIPAVFDFVARGVLARPVARRFLVDVAWSEADRWFRSAAQRKSEDAAAILASAERPEGPSLPTGGEIDALDEVFDLFWDDDGDRACASFFHQLRAQLPGWPPALRRRALAAIVITAHRRGSWPAAAAGVAAVFHPRFLAFPWVSRADRRASVKAVYAARDRAPRLSDDEVKALLALDLCRRPDGRLDLWVIGGVLHFVESHPYSRILRWVGTDAVIEAFVEDLEYSVPFLSLPDDSKRGRAYILERAARARPLARGLLLSLLTIATPVTGLDFLEALSEDDAAAVILELLRLLRRPGIEMTAKKTAVTARLAWKIASRAPQVTAFFRAWLGDGEPTELPLGVSLLGVLGVALPAPRFAEIAAALPAPLLLRLLAVLPSCSVFPYGKELSLAHALADHADPDVRGWARGRIPAIAESLPVVRPVRADSTAAPLDDATLEAIALSSDAGLAGAVAPCLARPTAGLTRALAKRPRASPNVTVCAAVLGSHDPMERVDAELVRFGSHDPAFLLALDREMVRVWEREQNLPPLGHAWIHRWERHAFALTEQLSAGAGLAEGLLRAASLSSEILRESVWDAVASAFAMLRWRDRSVLAALCTGALAGALLSRLDTDVGDAAARMLMAIVDARVADEALERLRPAVSEKLPDLAPSVRQILSSWIASAGIAGPGVARSARAVAASEAALAEARGSSDLEALEAWCGADDTRLAQEAALRLIELGEPGLARLLSAIGRSPPALRALIDSTSLWPEGGSLAIVRATASDPMAPADLRFRFAVALVERGEPGLVTRAIEAACVEVDKPWFSSADWERLLRLGETERSLALALAAAPHVHAYRRAMEHLLAIAEPRPEEMDAVRAFLEAGTPRLTELRRRAANWLRMRRDHCAFPVLLDEAASTRRGLLTTLAYAPPDLVTAAIDAVLIGGPRAAPEQLAITLLDIGHVDPAAKARAYERLLAEATTDGVRSVAAARVERTASRAAKLRALAEAFAWGVRAGRELTGRLFKVEMISGDALGYTRLRESRIFVSPLPIVRAAPGGREIVEGLILHELGHHLYHRGPEEERVWRVAQAEGIHGLLNLVADEHLERNLRGLDASHGDRLKRLAAYAFLHSEKDVPIADLLESLGGRAFDVLTAARLGVARAEGAVRVESAPLLQQMERSGLSFTRFFRALRMGLGDRHGDPLVRAGLDAAKGVRRKTMAELLDLARRLRAIFGWQARVVEHFGPHEALEGSAADAAIHGEGITQQELDAEIERVLDPDKRRAGDAAGEGVSRAWINVSPDERFEPIRNVVKVPRDPAEHARYADQVRFAARRMRRWFEGLGVTLEPQRLRLRGRRFDPSRALAVVVRGDPRMLIAREPKLRTDLFIGVLVDCSGSMATRGNIEKAKLFGVMLAEAAKGVRGVDLRLFGFTHTTVYDAGDAQRCAVHALISDGGNNDAAALWHAAQAARASRRRAKLLVMISDGLPTECSTAALRALVTRLGSRLGICCAQVAVQPLAEICFPHYVVLSEADPAPAVRRFGSIVAGLVEKAMAIA